jgi:transcription elongation factor Elf1
MALCPNCGAVLTCGCQQRTTSTGQAACQNCIADFEQQVAQQQRMVEQAMQAKLNPDTNLNS